MKIYHFHFEGYIVIKIKFSDLNAKVLT